MGFIYELVFVVESAITIAVKLYLCKALMVYIKKNTKRWI